MGRFFLGIFTVLLIIVLTVSGMWLADLLGIININHLVLQMAGSLPGLEDLAESYELGRKRSDVLKKREQDLNSWQKKLNMSETKLAEATGNFENDKLKWEKDHLPTAAGASPLSPNENEIQSMTDVNQSKYLAMIAGMKPAKAAAVLEKMPKETTGLILEKMRSSQASKIMECLSPNYVAELTRDRIKNNRQ